MDRGKAALEMTDSLALQRLNTDKNDGLVPETPAIKSQLAWLDDRDYYFAGF